MKKIIKSIFLALEAVVLIVAFQIIKLLEKK